MVNKKKYKFRGLVSMFKKGNCLSISIDSNINLSATQLHPIHHPAGSLSHLWRLKLNHTAPLGLPVLHLDVGIQHVAWAQGGKKRPQLIRQTQSSASVWAPLSPDHLLEFGGQSQRESGPGTQMLRTRQPESGDYGPQPCCHSSANRTTI